MSGTNPKPDTCFIGLKDTFGSLVSLIEAECSTNQEYGCKDIQEQHEYANCIVLKEYILIPDAYIDGNLCRGSDAWIRSGFVSSPKHQSNKSYDDDKSNVECNFILEHKVSYSEET